MHREANKRVERSIRDDKRKYVKDLAATAERVVREGNMKQLCDKMNKLGGEFGEPAGPLKHK